MWRFKTCWYIYISFTWVILLRWSCQFAIFFLFWSCHARRDLLNYYYSKTQNRRRGICRNSEKRIEPICGFYWPHKKIACNCSIYKAWSEQQKTWSARADPPIVNTIALVLRVGWARCYCWRQLKFLLKWFV